ncbi:MAG: hypothetical protein D6741_15270, partial [Planctomycetota bacterium]
MIVACFGQPRSGPCVFASSPPPVRAYTFGYWLNGWRKPAEDPLPDVLCLETGYFGIQLDLDDLRHVRFGLLNDDLDYVQALDAGASRLAKLPAAKLNLEITFHDKIYRAVTCRAGLSRDRNRLEDVRLWESGRYVQRYDLLGVRFEDDAGEVLPCDSVLELVAWPDKLVFNLNVAPTATSEDAEPPIDWSRAVMRAELVSNVGRWTAEQTADNSRPVGKSRSLTLACPVASLSTTTEVELRVRTAKRSWPVEWDPQIQAYRATISGLERDWETGYTDIRHYDEFTISV